MELRRLIEQVSHMDITLVAGRNGLENDVSWVHMVESVEASTFLEGGEITFTTGVGLSSSSELYELVQHLKKYQAAGVILNIGPYLEDIPQNVIDYCNENSLPLFKVPWKVHLAEIMRIFTYSITKEDRYDIETAACFQNAIHFPQQMELYEISLKKQGFQPEWQYTVMVSLLLDMNGKELSNLALDHVCHTVTHNLSHKKYKDFFIYTSDNKIIIILGNYASDNVHCFANDLNDSLNAYPIQSLRIYYGVGKTTKSIRCLYKSYHQALNIVLLQQKGRISSDQIFYDKLGMYRLLMGIDDQEIINDYLNSTIRPLQEYDKLYHSNLVEVLRVYLQRNGSVLETANELFVHRNTINYRLSKIESLTGMDLSDLNARLQLSTAFMLLDIT